MKIFVEVGVPFLFKLLPLLKQPTAQETQTQTPSLINLKTSVTLNHIRWRQKADTGILTDLAEWSKRNLCTCDRRCRETSCITAEDWGKVQELEIPASSEAEVRYKVKSRKFAWKYCRYTLAPYRPTTNFAKHATHFGMQCQTNNHRFGPTGTYLLGLLERYGESHRIWDKQLPNQAT